MTTIERPAHSAPNTGTREWVEEMPVAVIVPSPLNPRKRFDEAALAELAASIRAHGLQQPVVVRPLIPPPIDEKRLAEGITQYSLGEATFREKVGRELDDLIQRGGSGRVRISFTGREWETASECYRAWARERGYIADVGPLEHWRDTETGVDLGTVTRIHLTPIGVQRYELIMGERRWRASQLAGLTTIPARVRAGLTDAQALELAMVENLQRADLDPIEEAEGYAALNRVVGLKQAQIAAAVKRSQPAVANRMRLLELPEDVRERVRAGELTPAHGIALLRYKESSALVSRLAKWAVEESWTSKRLEDHRLLTDNYTVQSLLVREKLIAVVRAYEVDVATCEACPFGAYRASGYGGGVCLRPEHYPEVKAEREARVQAAIAAQTARAVPVAAAAPDAPAGAGEPAAAGLPRIQDLPSGGYEGIWHGRPPAGCTEACVCRRMALGWQEGEAIPICINPARFRELRKAEEKAEQKVKRAALAEDLEQIATRIDAAVAMQKVKRAALAEDLEQIATRIDAAVAIGRRELALVAATALGLVGKPTAAAAAAERHAPDLVADVKKFSTYEGRRMNPDILAAVHPVALLKLVAEALLRDDAEGRLSAYDGRTPRTDWYLERTAAVDAEPAKEGE